MSFKYRATVLEQLARHGVVPGDDTPPEVAHDFIDNLYLYEIRALRKQMRAGLIPKSKYANRVDELRKRYPVLSLPVSYWIENE